MRGRGNIGVFSGNSNNNYTNLKFNALINKLLNGCISKLMNS